jgi:hypothetical protein
MRTRCVARVALAHAASGAVCAFDAGPLHMYGEARYHVASSPPGLLDSAPFLPFQFRAR